MGGLKLIALAALLAAAFALAGCISQNRYVPCCVKSGIYNISTGEILPDPKCYYPNATLYGNCDIASTRNLNGTANCTQSRLCTGILDQNECRLSTTCNWTSGRCVPADPSGTDRAYYLLPVCVDGIPQNCINNRCQAMMCGYSGIRPGPAPVGTDFPGDPANPAPPFSQSDANSQVNLQGTSCDFKAMNRKLYNQVANSKGSLWVNSFRFGVGRSFADYEQSRLFFPASDLFCGANPAGGKDRFVNYLNAPSTWCAGTGAHYTCSANGLNFSTREMCSLYCFGREAPEDCNQASGTGYACLESKFVYSDQQACRAQCPIVADAGACISNKNDYPFLESDLRYKYKLNADFIYSSNSVGSDDDNGFRENCKQSTWREEGGALDQHYWCKDDAPWSCSAYPGSAQACLDAGWDAEDCDCLWWNPEYIDETGFRQGMWWMQSRVWSLDIDYGYYKEKLLSQAMPQPEEVADFECEKSSDCASGLCDKQNYNRELCTDAAGNSIECGCISTGSNSLSCKASNAAGDIPTYRVTGDYAGMDVGVSSSIGFSPSLGDGQVYFFEKDPKDIPVIKNCGIDGPESGWSGAPKCRYSSGGKYYFKDRNGDSCPFWKPSATENYTGTPVSVWKYRMGFVSQSGDDTLGSRCALIGEKDSAPAPYLKMRSLGWCEPCTYSTLAVQKVDFAVNPLGHIFQCLEFRGTYNYSAQTGIVNDGVKTSEIKNSPGSGIYGFDVPPVKKDYVVSGARTDGGIGNGPIERGYYDQGWFGHDVAYDCTDGWSPDTYYGGGKGWHSITKPDQAYLIEKVRTYLQSNVMPILDVQSASLRSVPGECKTVNDLIGGRIGRVCSNVTDYAPSDICGKWGGDGSAVYVVGDAALLGRTNDVDEIGEGDGIASPDLMGYFGKTWVGPNAEGFYNEKHALNGMQGAVYRALLMKQKCPNAPLTAINVSGYEPLSQLVGDKNSPGLLHRLFFKQNMAGYSARVARGTPDSYPDNIDIVLQGWHPTCGGSANQNESVRLEFEGRLNFSRAILSNFSKPSLIWQFSFPQGSLCNKTLFMDYLFDHQGEMVDAGITGLVYDDWRTANGEPYVSYTGDDSEAGDNGRIGTIDSVSSTALDSSFGASAPNRADDSAFCAVQTASRKVMGITKHTFGQKVYAENSPCPCVPCSSSDSATGKCISVSERDDPLYLSNPDLDQLFCLDGVQCGMPAGYTNYSYYQCLGYCANQTNCERCTSDPALSDKAAYCRVETGYGEVFQTIKDYSDFSDAYWDILGALKNRDKCCLNVTVKSKSGSTIEREYTYVEKQGIKQRNEFLQFPIRGEDAIDCGRGLDTGVLQYCNVKIPMSENHLFCTKVTK